LARGLALDFFAPFFVVVFTIDEFRSGLAPEGLQTTIEQRVIGWRPTLAADIRHPGLYRA